MSLRAVVAPASCLLGLVLLLPAPAVARDFSEADLEGDYAIAASMEAGSSNLGGFTGADMGQSWTGRLTFDGAGNVLAGFRTVLRPKYISGSSELRTEAVDETFTGRYSVASDGTGVMTIEPRPALPWDVRDDDGAHLTFPGRETLRFTLSEDGRRLRFTVEVRSVLRLISDPALFPRDLHQILVGEAEAQEAAPGAADEIESLREDVARLSHQLCEVLRLLNTPEGRRESSTPEVVEDCGTGFAWNGEGTDAPSARRGR